MNLIVNTGAVASSSRGVQRYHAAVMEHLSWPGEVESFTATGLGPVRRARELLQRGREGAIFWTPCQRGPLRAHRHVITVHDCINVEYVYRSDWRLPIYRRLMGAVLEGARVVVAISEATRAAILRNYPVDGRRIVVIRSGRHGLAMASSQAATSGKDPYVMMVTNALPHKNNLAACLAFARSRAMTEGICLRVVGDLSSDARDACRSAGIRVQEYQRVSDADLAAWYGRCLFLFSPSLDEGHNLPIAEALSAGANVLCSDIPVHREFYQGEVRFFDPSRWESMAAAIDAAVDSPGRWHDRSGAMTHRSFADVGADYRVLFGSLA